MITEKQFNNNLDNWITRTDDYFNKPLNNKEQKEQDNYMLKKMFNTLEETLKYQFKIYLKTFQKDKRDFIKCCEICLNDDKTQIHLYFKNLLTNRKSKKFIEIEKEFIPFLYSFEKEKVYKIIEEILNKIEVIK